MNQLNDILHELGISKVKLAKYLGVSRQMIYNYLELDDINKWPKDKKVLLFNLLGVKSSDEIEKIKIDTDYIVNVEAKINSLVEMNENIEDPNSDSSSNIFKGLKKDSRELLYNIVNIIKEDLEDEKDFEAYSSYRYLYHFLQAMSASKEIKYILAYIAKASGAIKPLEFAFDEEDQTIFESIMFSAMTLYSNGGVSKSKITESHKRFVNKIEHKMEEKLSRTMELNSIKNQALKELGYTEINEQNAPDIWKKMAEIQSRKVSE